MKRRWLAITIVLGVLLYGSIIPASLWMNAQEEARAAATNNITPQVIEVIKTVEVPVEKIVEVPVEVIKEVPCYITVEVEVEKPVAVIKEVKTSYNPVPFSSEQELRDWVKNWTPHTISWGVLDTKGLCEGFAYAMLIDAVNDNRLVGTQIDPYRNHMMVVVPIYTENRYLFVEPQKQTITDIFMGKTWLIN